MSESILGCPICKEPNVELLQCEECDGWGCSDCVRSTHGEWRGCRIDGPDACEPCRDRRNP
jgi:hypothetical protein